MKRKKTPFKRMISVMCTSVMILTLLFYGEKGNTLVVKATEGDIAWEQLATVFPDAAVCDAVKDKLMEKGVAEGLVVTHANLLSIDSIEICKKNSEGVINLSGLERLTELSLIDIDGDILSLAPLNNLISLRSWGITNADNDICFAQMSNVSSLTSISLVYSNGIKNLDGLEKLCNSMPQLHNLDLRYTGISDLKPVTKLTNIELLDIGDNKISDFSPLKSLTNLYVGSCCNSLTEGQCVVFEGSDRTVKNSYVDMNGNVIVPAQSDEFTYNATDNTITYVGDDKLVGETKATITIEEAKPEDAGSYKCVVTNATATVTSDVAKVEVKKEEATTQTPTTQAPTITEAVNADSAVTTGDTANPVTTVIVLLLALIGMILLGKSYRYKEQ